MRLTHQEKMRAWFVLGGMTLSIAVLILDSLYGHGVISAQYWAIGFTVYFAIYAYMAKDELIKKLLLFGLVAGIAELAADHWLVTYTDSLVYPSNEPFLLSSPAYMPLSWTVVLVEFGYIAWLLNRKMNFWKAGILLALFGAMLVPLYEHWAIAADWWSYKNTPMWGPVPYYIILAEGLLMLPIPFFVKKMEKGALHLPVSLGLVEGLVMLLACFIAWFTFS